MFPRQSIVSRFNIVRTNLIDNETTPLQVGNGNFAFNVDNTGMQVKLSIGYSLICGNPSILDVLALQYTFKLGLA